MTSNNSHTWPVVTLLLYMLYISHIRPSVMTSHKSHTWPVVTLLLSPRSWSRCPGAGETQSWCDQSAGSCWDERIACLDDTSNTRPSTVILHQVSKLYWRKCNVFKRKRCLGQFQDQRLSIVSWLSLFLDKWGLLWLCLVWWSSALLSGQFKLSVIMMLAPAPDGPELWKLF